MELKITTKEEEPLLARTKIECMLSFEGATPSYTDVAKQIANTLKSQDELIAIRHVYTEFGKRSAKVVAYAYKDEATKKTTEPKVKPKGAKKEEKKETKK